MGLVDEALFLSASSILFAKSLVWAAGVDPLILDLDGDGFEAVARDESGVYFDIDSDFFAEQVGWAFLVTMAFWRWIKMGNGRIDDISELFGDAGQSGFEALAAYDSNADGKIDANDAVWSDLSVWRDLNQDGQSEDGELESLDELDIVSIKLSTTPLDIVTPDGATLLAEGTFTRGDGTTGAAADAVFEIDDVNTRYRGETGTASWLKDVGIHSKGFGRITDLSVASSNDFDLGDLVAATAPTMTVPKLKTLREQTGEVLGNWSLALELTRELTPVLLETDFNGQVTLLDRGVYVEDVSGGYWTLKSGASVLDDQGVEITQPTLEDVLAQGAAAGQVWQLEQGFSPASRAEAARPSD